MRTLPRDVDQPVVNNQRSNKTFPCRFSIPVQFLNGVAALLRRRRHCSSHTRNAKPRKKCSQPRRKTSSRANTRKHFKFLLHSSLIRNPSFLTANQNEKCHYPPRSP